MSGSGNRRADGSHLGACPECDVEIPPANLLIRYESEDGWPRLFAECPQCGDAVHPE